MLILFDLFHHYFLSGLPKIDANLTFSPNDKAQAVFLIQQGENLAQEGKITEAISKYQQAQRIDSKVKISADNWNPLCWYGSLYGYAAKVIEYCEKAVEFASEDWGIRDSRALARAITGNTQGAIEDFKFVIENSTNKEYVEQTQGWLDSLQKGENPFTEEVLKEMR